MPATDDERAAIESVLGPPVSGWDGGQRAAADGHIAYGGRAARARRHLLLTVLHAVQERSAGSAPARSTTSRERLTVPPAEAYGVASFYALFRTAPSPGAVVHICDDLACQVNGAEELCERMTRRFGHEGSESAFDGAGVTWQRSPCLGPVRPRVGRAHPARRRRSGPRRPRPGGPGPDLAFADRPRRGSRGSPHVSSSSSGTVSLLRRVGQVDPSLAWTTTGPHGGYEMLRRAVALGPAGRAAGGQGRQAARPRRRRVPDRASSGRRSPPARSSPHYVVCNADESEPGTFKDRVLMEADPFALVEAMTVDGLRLRGGAGVHLHPRRVPAGRGAAAACHRAGSRARLPRAAT